MDNRHTARIFQFGNAVEHEELLTVANSGQAWGKASHVTTLVLFLNGFLLVLPLNTKGRIGDDIVEGVAFKLVIAQGVAVTHILGITTLDEHVGFSNSEGLFVQFLSELGDLCLRVYLQQLLTQAVEHLTRTHRHIIDGSRHTLFLQLLTLWSHQQFSHHIDNVASRKVGSCLFVITFRKLAHEFFEDVTHIYSTDLVGSHIGFL